VSPLSSVEIAEQLKMPQPTVIRCLSALQTATWVKYSPPLYQLGETLAGGIKLFAATKTRERVAPAKPPSHLEVLQALTAKRELEKSRKSFERASEEIRKSTVLGTYLPGKGKTPVARMKTFFQSVHKSVLGTPYISPVGTTGDVSLSKENALFARALMWCRNDEAALAAMIKYLLENWASIAKQLGYPETAPCNISVLSTTRSFIFVNNLMTGKPGSSPSSSGDRYRKTSDDELS
jgi:hypothetical protein